MYYYTMISITEDIVIDNKIYNRYVIDYSCDKNVKLYYEYYYELNNNIDLTIDSIKKLSNATMYICTGCDDIFLVYLDLCKNINIIDTIYLVLCDYCDYEHKQVSIINIPKNIIHELKHGCLLL